MNATKSLNYKPPKGLAFAIDELDLITRWAGRNAIRVVVRLDHGADGEEFEEVIAFHTGHTPLCELIMWRNEAGVYAQPLVGVMQQFVSVEAALDSRLLKQRTPLTDIRVTAWPT